MPSANPLTACRIKVVSVNSSVTLSCTQFVVRFGGGASTSGGDVSPAALAEAVLAAQTAATTAQQQAALAIQQVALATAQVALAVAAAGAASQAALDAQAALAAAIIARDAALQALADAQAALAAVIIARNAALTAQAAAEAARDAANLSAIAATSAQTAAEAARDAAVSAAAAAQSALADSLTARDQAQAYAAAAAASASAAQTAQTAAESARDAAVAASGAAQTAAATATAAAAAASTSAGAAAGSAAAAANSETQAAFDAANALAERLLAEAAANSIVKPGAIGRGTNTAISIPPSTWTTLPSDVQEFIDSAQWSYDAATGRFAPVVPITDRVRAEFTASWQTGGLGTARRMRLAARKADGSQFVYPLALVASPSSTAPITQSAPRLFPPQWSDGTYELQAWHDAPVAQNITGFILSLELDRGRKGADGALAAGQLFSQTFTGSTSQDLTITDFTLAVGQPVMVFRDGAKQNDSLVSVPVAQTVHLGFVPAVTDSIEVELVQGVQGEPGGSGVGSAQSNIIVNAIAQLAVVQGGVYRIRDGNAYAVNSTSADAVTGLLGVAVDNRATGNPVDFVTKGVIASPSYNFDSSDGVSKDLILSGAGGTVYPVQGATNFDTNLIPLGNVVSQQQIFFDPNNRAFGP